MNNLDIGFSLPSPAKINRLLHIVGRREDGYHLLQTLFQFLDFGDTLHFDARKDDKIIILPEGVCGLLSEKNIIYRAAKLIQASAQHKGHAHLGVTITLDKQIPLGAGLGGGSSNAATTLIGLNLLWNLNLAPTLLFDLGGQLGADVPVFLLGETAWGEGIGQELTPVEPLFKLDEPWVLLLNPGCEVNTKEMYAHSDLTRNTPAFKIGTLTSDEIKSIVRTGKNDFEPVVCRQFPEVNNAMKWLSNFGRPQLSGSGASVFSCFADEASARSALSQLPPFLSGQVVKAVNKSPLNEAYIGVSPSGKAQGFDPCIPRFES